MAGRNPFCTLLAWQKMGTALCQLFCLGTNQYWQKGQTSRLRWYLLSYLSFSSLPSCSQTTLKLVNHREHIREADVTSRQLKAKAGAKVALLTLEGAFSCVLLPPIPTPTQSKGASICFIFRWSNFWDHKLGQMRLIGDIKAQIFFFSYIAFFSP